MRANYKKKIINNTVTSKKRQLKSYQTDRNPQTNVK